MIQYYLDPDAERLSIALWSLARPARAESDRADRMFNVVKSLSGEVHLEVDTEFQFVVHPKATLGDLADILQSRLSADAIAALGTQVVNLRGQMVVASTEFAQVFKGQALDQPVGGIMP